MGAIGLQRRLQAQQPRRCVAFGSPRKQRNLRRFLAGSQLRFRAPGGGFRVALMLLWSGAAYPTAAA